jgi:DHA2 family multidrug resistance protein
MWGTSAMVVPALGPTFGGWLVTAVSWNWLFRINVPIGVVCVVLGMRLLPDTVVRKRSRLDTGGLVLGVIGLSLTVLGLSEGNDWGWASLPTVGCLAIGLASSWWFVRHELSTPVPLIDLRMLQHRAFRLTLIVVLFIKMSEFGRLVYLALELTTIRGYTPLRVGLIFMPAALCTGVSMQIGGRLTDRVGPRIPIMLGLSVVVVSTTTLGFLSLSTPVALIVGVLCVQGLGIGLTNAPVMVAGISQLPKDQLSQASALRTLTNQVAGAVAVALLGAVVAIRLGTDTSPVHAQTAYNAAFVVGAVGIVIALLVASRLPRGLPDLREGDLEELEALALAGE